VSNDNRRPLLISFVSEEGVAAFFQGALRYVLQRFLANAYGEAEVYDIAGLLQLKDRTHRFTLTKLRKGAPNSDRTR
jgi:hypothetical protein